MSERDPRRDAILWTCCAPLPPETEEATLRQMCVAYVGVLNPGRPAPEPPGITRRCQHCGGLFSMPAGSKRMEPFCSICR